LIPEYFKTAQMTPGKVRKQKAVKAAAPPVDIPDFSPAWFFEFEFFGMKHFIDEFGS